MKGYRGKEDRVKGEKKHGDTKGEKVLIKKGAGKGEGTRRQGYKRRGKKIEEKRRQGYKRRGGKDTREEEARIQEKRRQGYERR
jgi:hypothetical protein